MVFVPLSGLWEPVGGAKSQALGEERKEEEGEVPAAGDITPGMHPAPRHAASHVRRAGARVMPGVMPLTFLSGGRYENIYVNNASACDAGR